MNPETAVPLAICAAGADLAQDQLPAVSFIDRYRTMAAGSGPAAIGGPGAQPEGQVRCLPRARVGERVQWALAPDELLVTQPRIDGELEAVRVAKHIAYGHGYLVGAGQEQADRGKAGHDTVRPPPRRMAG